MKKNLYVGLGNVGPRFATTRHNLGAAALRAWTGPGEDTMVMIRRGEQKIHCLFPTTLMNESGQAVRAALQQIGGGAADLLVIHDDVELPLGQVCLTEGVSAKGHNGVRSIQEALGTGAFSRLRLGVGRPPAGVTLAEFVLEKFRPDELAAEQRMVTKALTILNARLSPE